jgi:multicomponent Na+:H+ antiporter subunit E
MAAKSASLYRRGVSCGDAMSFAIWSIVFGGVWVAVSGAFTLPNLLLGSVFGAASLFFIRGHVGRTDLGFRLWPLISLIGLFLYELMMSAVKVAAMVLRPDMNLKPGIFAYETKLTKDSHITLLANLITLTPGTLTVDVSDDKTTLYIHAVDCSDIEATRADIKNGFERKIREAFGEPV